MATAKRGSGSGARKRSHGFLKFCLGFLCALALVIVGGWSWLHYGRPPVATADPALPFEAEIVKAPLRARIGREMQTPPFDISEDVYEAGAHIYRQQCASCHGAPGEDVAFAKWMYPRAPQLWKKHAQGSVVGVSDDPPGETFWKIQNGIRLSGMPAYQHVLTTDEMWDVTLLLKHADEQLPDPVVAILKGK
jgi:mono/diheme cytochrome c family protein